MYVIPLIHTGNSVDRQQEAEVKYSVEGVASSLLQVILKCSKIPIVMTVE